MLPSLRIKNTDVNSRSAPVVPHITTKSSIPNQRIQNGGSVSTQQSGGVTFAGKGYLIGMLGLTYIKSYVTPIIITPFVSDLKPNVRIQNV